MTLAEHLAELRHRLIVCAAVYLAAGTLAFIFYSLILRFLKAPYCQIEPKNHCYLYVTSPLDGLSLRIKLAAFGGLVLAAPVILYQLWRFITPGLRTNERRYAVPFVVASMVLFLTGCAIAYLTLPHALGFLKAVGGPGLMTIYNPNSYLNLVLLMMVLFGVTFLFPVVLVSLELARVVTPAQLLHWWRWAVIGITLVAAIFTPSSDPFSMLAMAVPLVAFYFLSILVGKLFGR